MDLGLLDVVPELEAELGEDVAGQDGALPAHPHEGDAEVVDRNRRILPTEFMAAPYRDPAGLEDLFAEQDRVPRAHLGADLAPRAGRGLDEGQRPLGARVELFGLEDRRAADPEADRAAVAALAHLERQVGRLDRGQQRALLLGDEHERPVLLQPRLELLLQRLDLIGRDRRDAVLGEAERAHHALDVDLDRLLALQGHSGARVLLMPGHAGDPVVHDDGDDVALVVEHVEQRRDSAVEEGRVADDRDMALAVAGLRRAVGDADALAHTARRCAARPAARPSRACSSRCPR